MRRLLVLFAVVFSIAVHGQDPNLQRGFAPGKAYDFLGLDSVSLMNGNLNVRIPLGQKYSLGPALEYQFTLAYNSKVWEIEYAGVGSSPQLPQSWAVTETRSNAGFGWQLTLGTLLPPKVHGVHGPQQGWTYLSPDGSEHEFPTVDDVAQAFTEDGSYLRLRRIPANPSAAVTHREIDFPDGVIRQFDADGNLTEIRDRYGYKVKVTRTATLWTVTEEGPGGGSGRTHTIELASALNFAGQPYVQENFRTRPVEVNLAAFGASSNVATYQLAYTDIKVTVGPCADADHDADHYVPRLNSITFPDQSAFVMTHLPSALDRCTTGTLNVLTLPTGGKIRWTLGSYELTNQACIKPGAGVLEDGWRKGHAGVRVRSLETSSGTVMEKRTYTPFLPERSGGWVEQRCGGGTEMWLLEKPPDVFKNTVTVSVPTGPSSERVVEKTTNYFSAYPAVVDGTMTNGALVSPAQGIEYGLPIARGTYVGDNAKPETLRFLSSQTFACDGATCSDTVARTTYLKYALEQSFSVSGSARAKNPRVDAQRTVFEDDSCGASDRCYTDSASSNFDDFGHYRQSVFTSNIPGTREKTTFTNYTPLSSPWLLNIYNDAWVREGQGATATGTRSQAAFDPMTGAMTSLRTYKATGSDPTSFAQGGNDLLTAWCRDAGHGFVTSERYFGGDGGAVPTTPCAASHGTNDYFINHTYTFNGAIVATHKAQYADTTHFIADEEYDRNTGWPNLVRDSAGVPTKYTFDSHARILSIRPYDSVETHYDYREATGDPHKIALRQECPTYDSGLPANPAQCTAGSLTRSVYYYDDLGRLIQERRQFPSLESGTIQTRWAVTSTEYGPNGRREKAFVPTKESSEAYSVPGGAAAGTSWTYDHLGRMTLETRPDGTTTSLVYRGDRETERHVGGQKRSTETFNGLGQLVKVTQYPDPGVDVVTSYGYDAGGRLTSVRMSAPDGALQERTFDYDGRGFLRWESQPESGMASYTYDARGHVTAKDQSAARTQFDLRYAYDDAERLLTLTARNPYDLDEFRVLKEFAFAGDNGSSGSAVDLRKGKLITATRYNYGANELDKVYQITDTYRYLDAAGRRTHRTTSIIEDDSGYDILLKNVDTSVAYNALGLPRNVQYPTCTDCGLPSVDPVRSAVNYTYQRGRLHGITGFVHEMSYWPSGLRHTLVHGNGRTDEHTVDAMPRPSRIAFTPTPASRCLQPTFISPPANGNVPLGGGNATLSVVAGGTGPFEYEWVRVSDLATVGDDPSITVHVTANESFYVTVKNACGYEQSATITVTVGACVPPTISSITKLRQPDGKWLLKPQLAARQNPTFSWLRLSDSQVIAQTETVIVPAPGAQVTYRLTVTDSCGNAQSEITLTPAPTITSTALVALATGLTQVTVSWPQSFNVSHYVVERRSGTSWQELGQAPTNSYVDMTVTAGRSYAYRAYAVRFSEKSDYSNSDIATARSFTPATVGGYLSALHADEMLAAVNSVRDAVGWPAVAWDNILVATDSIPASDKPVTATHITSARARMNEALSALGVPLNAYTDPALSGVSIRAAHINEVQQRAQ